MSLVLTYGSREAAFTAVDLGTQAVRLGAFSVSMAASMGDIATSVLAIDDPTGDAGHSGDQIKGYHTLEIIEDDAPAGSQLILSAITGDRQYASADSLITGDAVRISIDLADCNRISQFQLFRGSASFTRPAETVGARITALIANAATPFVDSGLVVYPTTLMDANDYNGQTAASVLDDCAETVGFNWYLYKKDESATDYSLWFDDPNTSTAYSSDLRISNAGDADSNLEDGDGVTHTWEPLKEPTLKRSPQNLASGILMPWAGGTYFGFRGATRDIYGDASITAADSNVRSLSAATARVDRLLWQASTEEDVIQVSLNLPRANVNDVREGQRMQAKFRQLPGYKSAYSWFRVMYRTVSQQALTDEFYTVDLTLSPQEAAQPAGAIVQQVHAYIGGVSATVALPNPITPGNLLVVAENRWKGNGTDPVSPNVNPGAGDCIGGTGGWTASSAGVVSTATSGDRSMVGMWYKTATTSQQSGPVFSAFTWVDLYEITDVTTTGLTVVSQNHPGSSSDWDVGSLGSPATGDVAIMVTAGYCNLCGTVTFSPNSDWTTDQSYGATYFSSRQPYWVGHSLGNGTATEAEVGASVSMPWCGIAINFPGV